MFWFLLRLPEQKIMEISVGHTPDSDDAFMFYGMFTGKVPSPDFKVNHVIEDIEKLNQKGYRSAVRCNCSLSSCLCIHSRIYNIEKWRKFWNWLRSNCYCKRTDDY